MGFREFVSRYMYTVNVLQIIYTTKYLEYAYVNILCFKLLRRDDMHLEHVYFYWVKQINIFGKNY